MLRCKSSLTITAMSAALFLTSSAAHAVTEVWDVATDPTNGFGGLTSSWSLSDPDSAHAAWNVFNAYPLDTTPDAGSFGFGSASVRENTGGAFLTGGGNIYSFSVPTDFTITLAGSATTTGGSRTVALRLETLGSLVDPASLSLTLNVGGVTLAPTSQGLVYQELLGGFGGAEEERVFVWENVASDSYTFDFNASSSSMSLAQVAVFASPTVVPEPGTALLMMLGLAGLTVAGKKND